MGISDRIETFIIELLKDEAPDSWIELRRNELASVFNCVPSQINYVISTRFNPEHGYVVESRRGGGGYLKIKRVSASEGNPILETIKMVPEHLDYSLAKKYVERLAGVGAIDKKCAEVILAAVSDTAISVSQPQKDRLRANILKNTLAAVI